MSNSKLLKEDNKVIRKQSLTWHFISIYLEMLHGLNEAIKDEEFIRLLSNLEDYIEKIIVLPNYDITGTYVTVEYEK